MAFSLGLTGGIGSGKSTVAGLLAKRGAAIIDTDAISRATTAAGGSAIESLRTEFGSDFLTPLGALDRDRMRARVFQDTNARQRLEAIIHPLVALEAERQAQAALADGYRWLVFELPLLTRNSRWMDRLDGVLVIDCSPQTQVRRVTERSRLCAAQVEQIMATQIGRPERLALADWVILNEDLDLNQLGLAVDALPLPLPLP